MDGKLSQAIIFVNLAAVLKCLILDVNSISKKRDTNPKTFGLGAKRVRPPIDFGSARRNARGQRGTIGASITEDLKEE